MKRKRLQVTKKWGKLWDFIKGLAPNAARGPWIDDVGSTEYGQFGPTPVKKYPSFFAAKSLY